MIDNQINDYLAEHQTYLVKTVSYIMAGVFEKALVIFEYPGAKPQTTNEQPQHCKAEGKAPHSHENFKPKT